jgi:CHRD domain
MRCNILIGTLGTATFMLLGAHANAADFSATLSGFEEVGEIKVQTKAGSGTGAILSPLGTGAILSPGTATLDLDFNRKAGRIAFRLTYSSLTSAVNQANIEFGKKHVAGGIMVFLCSNLSNGPVGIKPCPTPSGTVTGTITSASVVGPTAENVAVGNFGALVAALVSNTAYANIHTVNFPGGEIRGQILKGDEQSPE